MSHMVIFQAPGGNPGYNQFDSLESAVEFVEQLRNERDVTNARIFALEEVKFEMRPYFKVELQALTSGSGGSSGASSATPSAAPAAAPAQPAPAPAAPSAPAAPEPPAPSAPPAPQPSAPAPPSAAPAPPSSPQPGQDQPDPGDSDQPARRGLFGR